MLMACFYGGTAFSLSKLQRKSSLHFDIVNSLLWLQDARATGTRQDAEWKSCVPPKVDLFFHFKLHLRRLQNGFWQKHHEKWSFQTGLSSRGQHWGMPALSLLRFLSARSSPGIPMKMPQENTLWLQLASEVLEQRNEPAELMKLRSELCKYCTKEFANICSNQGLEFVSTVPTSHNVSWTLCWSTCTNELLFKRAFRQSVIRNTGKYMLRSEQLCKYFLRWVTTPRTFPAICEHGEPSVSQSRTWTVELRSQSVREESWQSRLSAFENYSPNVAQVISKPLNPSWCRDLHILRLLQTSVSAPVSNFLTSRLQQRQRSSVTHRWTKR